MPEYCPLTGTHATGNVGFNEDILPIFQQFDCPAMRSIFDITDWESCRQRSAQLQVRVVERGDMPPGGLPQQQRALVAEWIKEGCPKYRAYRYAAFFLELDSYTEYYKYYNAPENYMPVVLEYFDRRMGDGTKAINAWWRWVASRGFPDETHYRKELNDFLGVETVRASILKVNSLMVSLMEKHFPGANGGIDLSAFSDAVEFFAKDQLPPDEDRRQRVRSSIPQSATPKERKELETYADCYARYHRMDGESMWFNWAAHADMALMIENDSDTASAAKKIQLAGTTVASVIDFVFRKRGKTRPEYSADPGRALVAMRRAMKRFATDLSATRAELYTLVSIYSSPSA
ncbi:hypothetical protein [Horticoccus sp. 23ND18S-11]|uniref:hypothetical protein n=1 Tax=Horticoccus sp. 23ND18S-11 TaxID=3391832 RepID=UPI0039C965F4